MSVKKAELKILRYVYRHKFVQLETFQKEYPGAAFSNKYLHISDHRTIDESGFPVGNYPLNEIVTLTDDGIIEVESRQFFNVEYVLSSLVIPVIVGVSSSIITALILLLLG